MKTTCRRGEDGDGAAQVEYLESPATETNDQIKSANKPGEITFDWTQVDVRAPGSSFPDQASIERFINGKMTKDYMRSIRYFEIVWADVDGKIVVTSRTRAVDGTLGPVTSVKR